MCVPSLFLQFHFLRGFNYFHSVPLALTKLCQWRMVRKPSAAPVRSWKIRIPCTFTKSGRKRWFSKMAVHFFLPVFCNVCIVDASRAQKPCLVTLLTLISLRKQGNKKIHSHVALCDLSPNYSQMSSHFHHLLI